MNDTENKAQKHPEKLEKGKQIKVKEIQREETKEMHSSIGETTEPHASYHSQIKGASSYTHG